VTFALGDRKLPPDVAQLALALAEGVDHVGVELLARLRQDLVVRRRPAERATVRTIARHRIESIGNGEDARALRSNAVQRCDAVRAEDPDSCRRMALGEGTVSGTAAAGGVVKELVTIEPDAAVPTR